MEKRSKVADSNNVENKMTDDGNENKGFFEKLFKKKENKTKPNMVSLRELVIIKSY